MKDVLKEALKKLDSNSYREKEEAIEAIVNIGNEEVVDVLIGKIIIGEDRLTNELIYEAIKKIRGAYAVNRLLKLLNDDSAYVRNFAFELLCEIGMDDLEAIMAEVKNEDRNVRKFIVDILGRVGDKRAINCLLEALKDDDINVVQGAVEAICNIGDEKELEKIIEYLLSSHLWVQWAIVEGVKKKGNRYLIKKVLELPWGIDNIILNGIFDMVKEKGDLTIIESLLNLYYKIISQLKLEVFECVYEIYKKSGNAIIEVLVKSGFFDEILIMFIGGVKNASVIALIDFLDKIDDYGFIELLKSNVFSKISVSDITKLYYSSDIDLKIKVIKLFRYFDKSKIIGYIEEILKNESEILKLEVLNVIRELRIGEVSYLLPDLFKSSFLMPTVVKIIKELKLTDMFTYVYEQYFEEKDMAKKVLLLDCMTMLKPNDVSVIKLIRELIKSTTLDDELLLKILNIVSKIENKDMLLAELSVLLNHPNMDIAVTVEELMLNRRN